MANKPKPRKSGSPTKENFISKIDSRKLNIETQARAKQILKWKTTKAKKLQKRMEMRETYQKLNSEEINDRRPEGGSGNLVLERAKERQKNGGITGARAFSL